MAENSPNCEAQNEKAKSSKAVLAAQIARLVRREGLDDEGWRYIALDGNPERRPSRP